MAKRKGIIISRRILGGLVLLGILFQYLLPMIGIGFLSKLSLLFYLIVGIYLFFSNFFFISVKQMFIKYLFKEVL